MVQFGANRWQTNRSSLVKSAPVVEWHYAAPLLLALALAAHLATFTAVSPQIRALGAWFILLLPGALLTRLFLPMGRDGLRNAWMMLVGALVICATLLLALTAFSGALTWWMMLALFDGVSLIAGWLLLTRQNVAAAEPQPAAPRHPFAALAVILLLAAGLRLTMLGTPETHVDEARVMLAATALVSGDDGALFIRDKGPVEVLLVSGPLALTGQLQEFSGRLPFALAGIGVALGAYLLARALWRDRDEPSGITVGLLAAALLTIDGLMIGFSRTIQYQSIVALLTLAAVWLMVQPDNTGIPAWRFLTAAALSLAVGILGHYDAGYVAPALLLVLIVTIRRHSLRAILPSMTPAVVSGGALLAAFFVPFVLHPRFSEYTLQYLSGRVGAGREGLGLVNNLGLYETLVTFYNAAIPVYVIAGLLVAGGALWLIRYTPARSLGIAGAALLLLGYAIQLYRPEWFMVAEGVNLAAFAFAPPFALVFSRRAPVGLRLLLLWFGAIFAPHAFLIAIPNTHFMTMHMPAALLAGWALVDFGRLASERIRRSLTAVTMASAAILLVYGLVYVNVAFLRQTPEYVRTYPAARPPFFPSSYGDQLPQDQGFYGFPRADGWKAIGELYRRGVLQGTYGSNQKPEVTGWYLQGQPRCETNPTYYLLTYRESYILPPGYYLFGYVRVAGERVIAIYRNSYVDGPPRDYDMEPRTASADRAPVGGFPIGGAMGEYLPQYPLAQAGALRGYDLTPAHIGRGAPLNLALYWDEAAGMRDAPVLELVDSSGRRAGEVQLICPAEPAERWRETSLRVAWWRVIPDRALPPGEYAIRVYDGARVVRLPGVRME